MNRLAVVRFGVSSLVVLGAAGAQALTQFQSGQVASAAAVNRNFTLVTDAIAQLGVAVTPLVNAVLVDGNGDVSIPAALSVMGTTGGQFLVHSFAAGGGTQLVSSLVADQAGPQLRFLGGNGTEFMDIGQSSNGSFVVESNDLPRLTVLANGNVGVGIAAPVHMMHLHGTGSSTNNQPHFVAETDGGQYGPQLRLKHGGPSGQEWVLVSGGSGNGGIGAGNLGLIRVGASGPALVINPDGTCRNGSGSWSTFSDQRLKQDIRALESGSALQSLLALRGVTFEYTKDAVQSRGVPSGKRVGFVAQDVEKVFPQWVGSDAEGMKHVTEQGVTALMVEALRELDARNQALTAKTVALAAQQQQMVELQVANKAMAAELAELKQALQPLLASRR